MMDQYRYKVVAAVVADLDALGMDGWQLKTVDDGMLYFWKPYVPPTAAEVKAAEAEKEEAPVGWTTEIVDPPKEEAPAPVRVGDPEPPPPVPPAPVVPPPEPPVA
jgi:hypothetical protein